MQRSQWLPFGPAYGSPLHHGASLGYGGWGDSSLSRVAECGTRAGETAAGEHQQNQSSTEPRLAHRCAVHSSRGLHNIPVKYNCF
ncbi:Hypothetical protein SMAX5B_013369 [Scophthalmus maximus]|uniref:Uncharacterized protein n=1 Tax=Scophthalmus maximus TaxID=52904 RepID=A0A2U9B4X5_SCOMX|nr:Hypothetical protein SMAX5B_013369 [Scophthalmus maximus]